MTLSLHDDHTVLELTPVILTSGGERDDLAPGLGVPSRTPVFGQAVSPGRSSGFAPAMARSSPLTRTMRGRSVLSEIRLFRIQSAKAAEVAGTQSDLERPLQSLIEQNLDALLGVRFLATEYRTGKSHAGRIDTLGLDEDNCPTILEYKRSVSESVINQGLFYLDWMMDHQAEFELLVLKTLGKERADAIDWTAPRLICIASDFTKYDVHSVQQMQRHIELVRYKQFGPDLLLLEQVTSIAASSPAKETRVSAKNWGTGAKSASSKGGSDKTVVEWLEAMPDPIDSLFQSLETFVLSLGDDVQRKDLKLYVAFRRLRNFATVCFAQAWLYV